MSPPLDLQLPYIRVRFRLDTEALPTLLDVSGFLYDLNLLYEVSRLALDARYRGFSFTDYVWFRRGRPLNDQDRLRLENLQKESPLEMAVAITVISNGAVAALWGVVQIIEKISNARLNRRKLKAEVEKLERENILSGEAVQSLDDRTAVRNALRAREAEGFYERAAGRLEVSSIRISGFDIDFVTTRNQMS